MIKRSRKSAYTLLTKRKQYKQFTLDDLHNIIKDKGFELIEYNKYHYSDELKIIIEKLDIENDIQEKDCFFYLKDNLKFIFMNEEVSDEDKYILLSHELGHIYDTRILEPEILYSEIQREDYANEFSHYLRNPAKVIQVLAFNLNKPVVAILTMVAVLALFAGAFVMNDAQTASQNHTIPVNASQLSPKYYYVTTSGFKFHKNYCKHVRYKTNITAYNLDDALSEGYEPCLDCIGEYVE